MAKSVKAFQVDEAVQWKWLGRAILGVVKEFHFEPIVKTIKEKKIKRNGSVENPAYYVQSEAGNFALKLHTELQARGKKNSKTSQPEMFRK